MQVVLFQALPQLALRLRSLLMKAYSVGRLQLHSSDPLVAPDIRLNLLSAQEDIRRMRASLRTLGELIQLEQLVELGTTQIVFDDGEPMTSSMFIAGLREDDWVDAYAHRLVRHYVHPIGTARMGSIDDELAVVDQHRRISWYIEP
jgi:choline dehydrogenase